MRPVHHVNMERRLVIDGQSIDQCVAVIGSVEQYPIPSGSLDIAFIDAAECSRLHEAFFNDPEITDVMTFPGMEEDEHAGDIAICPQVAAEACHEHGTGFAEELTLYLVHACLHLAGLLDNDVAARSRMRKAEVEMMAFLRSRDAFLKARWEA